MVGKDVGLVLDTISARRSDSFMAACRSLVGDLAASAPASLKLLEMLAFASHVNVPVELASAYLLNMRFIRASDVELATMAFERAVAPLVERNLVSLVDWKVDANLLTQSIMRQILAQEAVRILARLSTAGEVGHDDLYVNGWGGITAAGRTVCQFAARVRMEELAGS